MYSIDQTPQGIPVTVTLQGSTVRMAMSGIGGAFEGTMTADGNTIAGTFTQGGKPLPLSLQRATPDTAWAIPQPPQAMAADARAVFDVATIKPSNPNQPGRLFTVKGRQVITVNTTLADLITFAYELHAEADHRGTGLGRQGEVRHHRAARSAGHAEHGAVAGDGAAAADGPLQAGLSSRQAGTVRSTPSSSGPTGTS